MGNFYCSGMATQVFLEGSEVLYQKNQEWSLYINFFTGPCGGALPIGCLTLLTFMFVPDILVIVT